MFQPEDLRRSPNPLAAHYRRFRVADRLLFTGHSHQAWPDCALEGQLQAFTDAAELVDGKWERAFARAEEVRRGFARLLDDADGGYALAASTHDLLVRFLSALPLRARPRLVTTDAEFHTVRRQLDRLGEEGIEVVKVPHTPAADVAARLAAATDDRTAAVVVSAVFYSNAQIVPGLAVVMERCRQVGAALLVDAYHAVNVVSFSLPTEGLEDAFVVGGGYKYCQLGEGNCFLRIPAGCALRPVITGWFGEYDALAAGERSATVPYPAGPGRFAGATYDPTSHYRGARVFQFFQEHALHPPFLRAVSQHQIARLAAAFDALDADPAVITRDRSVPLEGLAGFLALRAPAAGDVSARLRERGVSTDFRGQLLRLGPAPYLSDQQLDTAIAALAEVVRG
jgi:kynureninase